MRYADAGVDISRAEQAKERIRRMASRTFTRSVMGGIGSFGALFALDIKRWREPVLVSSTDGPGTKLKVAAAMGVHSTVGADLVNHCVNDILTLGAEPLFFLDYLALGRIDPDVVEQLVEGMTRACHLAGCALVGGETAELPDTYAPGEYDVAGFIVGAVERSRILKTSAVHAGDVLLALPSLGLHTNGYSLARKLVFEIAGLAPDSLRRGNRQQNRRRTAHAAPLLLADAQKRRRPGLGLGHGAHHRRRHSRQSPARAAARHPGRRRAGLLAGAADLYLPRPPRQNRAR